MRFSEEEPKKGFFEKVLSILSEIAKDVVKTATIAYGNKKLTEWYESKEKKKEEKQEETPSESDEKSEATAEEED